ncbi:unnamed protein product, partial [Mesorhabditis belari]|uniref:Uncharacterized protein n=1 Tax=Mesorhabditis belari TaxID=2138241 RepID=A0AAF3J8M4_9BILA
MTEIFWYAHPLFLLVPLTYAMLAHLYQSHSDATTKFHEPSYFTSSQEVDPESQPSSYSIFASFFFACHSTIGTIIQLTCYDTYREFVFRLIRCENPIKKKKKLHPIARVAAALTKDVPKTNITERSRISKSSAMF